MSGGWSKRPRKPPARRSCSRGWRLRSSHMKKGGSGWNPPLRQNAVADLLAGLGARLALATVAAALAVCRAAGTRRAAADARVGVLVAGHARARRSAGHAAQA